MKENNIIKSFERTNIAHLVLLFSCTFFTIALFTESLILGWETWMLIVMPVFLAVSWGLYFSGVLTEQQREWVYAFLIMIMFLYYGTHETSLFDMGAVMCVLIMIFTMSGSIALVDFATLTYFITLGYDIIMLVKADTVFSPLLISQLILHAALLIIANRLASIIIKRDQNEKELYTERIAQLEETNRRTEDFLTNVSHELRTPINAVTGITALVLNRVKDDSIREDVYSVQRAGYRLFEQIGDILDYTEIDTGRIVVSNESYMITSLLNDLIVEYRMMMTDFEQELIFDVDPRLPAVMVGDGPKIKKIIRHLVSNAIKFTKKGGILVRIYPLKKPYGINLIISVEDTGIGIDPESLSMIKERFYQVNSGRSRRAGGLGLGLSIVCGLTIAMDGFMQIDSKEGSGTVVTVSIPQQVSDPSAAMTVEDREELCPALYIRPEKYPVPRLREFYNQLVRDIVNGLDLKLHSVGRKEELVKVCETYKLTHLFLGVEEYEEDPAFFENLESNTEVIIFARASYELPPESRAKLLIKPLYSHAVVSILNIDSDGLGEYTEKQMRCDGVKALVVDDENMNLLVAEGVFTAYGMEVHTASGGAEAIEICERENFDIIFMDHMMPEMDGVEVMKRLRKLEQEKNFHMVIVALTANAVSGAREMFLSEGFDEFVSKPIERMELERVLRKVLNPSVIRYVNRKSLLSEEDMRFTESMENEADKGLQALNAQGIDVASGIKYCNNDRAFYEELLTKYAHDALAKRDNIQEYYELRDMRGYQIAVHALKSTSKMIGAMELSEAAKHAEEAAKRSDMAYIEIHHDDLMADYRKVTDAIIENLGIETGEAIPEDELEQIGEKELKESFVELKDALSHFEAEKAESIIAELTKKSYGEKKLREELAKVKELTDDFDIAAAAQALAEVENDLMGGDPV